MIQDGGLTWSERVWPVGQGCGGEGGVCSKAGDLSGLEGGGGIRAGLVLGEMD